MVRYVNSYYNFVYELTPKMQLPSFIANQILFRNHLPRQNTNS